jgi:phytoene dehydrogenase-like protein
MRESDWSSDVCFPISEQHFELGGLAAFFRRKGHIFDVSLHGFPHGMQKSFRKYWGKEFAERIVPVKSIRFDNPMFTLETTFTTEDFTRILVEHFKVPVERVNGFYAALAAMNYYDDRSMKTRELFEQWFPGRPDVWRLLMEPITYANGSTLDEPAISYGIVFSNFMNKGVFTFLGGTDLMIEMMKQTLTANGVDWATKAKVEKIIVENKRVAGVVINGQTIGTRAVISNASLPKTVNELAGAGNFEPGFLDGFQKVRVSTGSSQVYIGLRKGEKLPFIGDLLFTSTWPDYNTDALCAFDSSSRTYSVYYPEIRPGKEPDYTIVASMNSRYEDWAIFSPAEYAAQKEKMIEDALNALAKYVPNIREITDYTEAATPKTFERYTGHINGASFGTKFEGLDFSMNLNKQVAGLFHTGSVGIIMSGWLGSVNYGIMVANEADKHLRA